jgi:hypothetical protein
MIRALSSIRTQARIPRTDDEKSSFAEYVVIFCDFVHLHHVGVPSLPPERSQILICLQQEEKFFFPECEKRVPRSMVENVEQHEAFQQGLESLRKYALEVQKFPTVYDERKVVTLVEAFGDDFVHHLHDEIPSLSPEKMRTIFPDQKDYEKTLNAMMRWTVSNANKVKGLPWVMAVLSTGRLMLKMLAHHEGKTAPWWPDSDIPGVVQFVARNILSRFNARHGLWR